MTISRLHYMVLINQSIDAQIKEMMKIDKSKFDDQQIKEIDRCVGVIQKVKNDNCQDIEKILYPKE